MRGRALHLLFAGLFALVGALGSYAQTSATPETASVVSCVVTDSSDARIPNAEVVFESDAGIVRTRTDDAGELNTKLKSGKYNITVRSQGFKTAQVLGFLVEGPTPKALNIRLAVGAICEDCSGWISNAIPVHVDTADLPSKFLQQRLTPTEVRKMKTFAGTWQSTIDPLGRSNLVINLKADGGSLTGTVKYLNSEHLETVATVGFVFLENNALTFQTDDGASWRLVPKQRPNFATLWNGTNKLPIEKTIKSK